MLYPTDLDILRQQLLPIASDLQGQLTFAISDEQEFEDELKSLGFDDWGEDVAVAIWASTREKYRMSDELDVDSLREFIEVSKLVKLYIHINVQYMYNMPCTQYTCTCTCILCYI